MQVAVAAAQALELIGLPEARLEPGPGRHPRCLAPKSNAVIVAYERAAADVRAGLTGPVPAHLRDTHYPGSAKLGAGKGYRYPHDFPGGVVAQQYAPDVVDGSTTTSRPTGSARRPSGRGAMRTRPAAAPTG